MKLFKYRIIVRMPNKWWGVIYALMLYDIAAAVAVGYLDRNLSPHPYWDMSTFHSVMFMNYVFQMTAWWLVVFRRKWLDTTFKLAFTIIWFFYPFLDRIGISTEVFQWLYICLTT